MRNRVALGLFVLFTLGCADRTDSGATPQSVASAAAAVAPGGTLTGIVREQIAVEPYVYVRLETPTGDVWAAVNQSPLTLGEPVTVYNVLLMEQFASETLKRTFDRIYFGSLQPPTDTPTESPTGTPPTADGADPALASTGAPPAADAKVGPIARASGADARTIGALWTERSHLVGSTVSIRGVVVKYNPGVMGKNWIHLQDGSGDAARGTHDLAVTSQDAVAVGDTVTVTGTVRINRDLGAGYTYALIVEDAKVKLR